MTEVTQQPKNFPAGKAGNQKRGGGSGKLRGLPKDSPAIRLSKTLSWLLRHGAQSEGLAMRADGYVKVADLSLDFTGLQQIVDADSKQRYSLVCEIGEWWIKASQGHSIKAVQLDLKPILTIEDIPSCTAVHGTTKTAWQSISSQGLSKMTRNHIHLAQGVSGENVISGMRKSCDIFIFIDIPKAIAAGIKFFLSDNGVVLSEGNEKGFLEPRFFLSVQNARREALAGWEGEISSNAKTAGTVNFLNTSSNSTVPAVSSFTTPTLEPREGREQIQS